MSGKFKNSRKNKTTFGIVAAVIAVLLTVLAVVFMMPDGDAEADAPISEQQNVDISPKQEIASRKIQLREGLEVQNIGSYTGIYMEDGTDEVLSNILMMKLHNAGTEAVEYARITMDVDGQTAEFTVSTLKPGATVILLEKNRMTCDKSVDYMGLDVVCENLALFDKPLELHEDKLDIEILDGAINVTNISGINLSGKITIYYKNTADGMYYGGITYRITLEDGMKDGEIRQLMADHFSDTASEILFITIAQ